MDSSPQSKPDRTATSQRSPIVLAPSTPHRPPLPVRTIYSDRFIPSRTGSNFALFDVSPSSSSKNKPFGEAYESLLRSVLLGDDRGGSVPLSTPWSVSPSRNIFRYKCEVPRRALRFDNVIAEGAVVSGRPKPTRKVPCSAYKVLDAPALQDDFYMNLVDWSSQNFVAVGLGNCVYIWNACTSEVTKLCELGSDDNICSVGWSQRGTYLAIGTRIGKVQIWDASQCLNVRTIEGHNHRVGALSWSSHLLASGSRDKKIIQHDIRAQDSVVSKLRGHTSEVCGLKWSLGNGKLASGGNDNKLLIWDRRSVRPILKYSEHTAAVKAIAWSPHMDGHLASGGGTSDRCIRFWNTNTNSLLNCVDTGSQVCSLAWSKNVDELVSTHGYSEHQIIIWHYPSLSKVATLTGHTQRVLYLAMSPDGQTIVTGAGDETLRFWNAFPSPKSKNTSCDFGSTSLGRCHIR